MAVQQYGEGNYKLGDVKMVKSTADFYSLDEATIRCQKDSRYEDCVTKKYLEALVAKCSCLPFNLLNYTNADKEVKIYDKL